MDTNAIQNETTVTEDDAFLAELEAELGADSADSLDITEVGEEEVIAADADDATEEEVVAAPSKKAKKGKAKAKAKNTDEGDDEVIATPKRPSLSGMPPSAALHTALGNKVYDYCVVNPKMQAMDAEARKVAINEFLANDVDTLAKKVKEKAINVFLALSGQATLSVYTRIALKLLKDKGEFTGADLKAKYLTRPYSPGTSSAQSSQMMMLLPALQIAERKGNLLVLNEDSPIFDILSEE